MESLLFLRSTLGSAVQNSSAVEIRRPFVHAFPRILPSGRTSIRSPPRTLGHLPRGMCVPLAGNGHDRHHHLEHDHHHHHHHHYHHHHDHGVSGKGNLTGAQEAFILFARSVRWADMADLLRENFQICCLSMGLLLLAAVFPYALPAEIVKPAQKASIAAAFSLVGITSAFDALVDIAGGRVNIHVLMTVAAFALVFMGNSLEGGLLLAMFNLAHRRNISPSDQ